MGATDEEIAAAVRAQMKTGGKPVSVSTQGPYALNGVENSALALRLTNEVLRNLEERIITLEHEAD